jgi:hypothetical protein
MAMQNVLARIEHSGLHFTWEIMGEPVALSIQIATNIDMTQGIRTFVIPPVSGLILDVGAGVWFFRVGAWHGTQKNGKIVWTGVYGPAVVETTKLPVSNRPPTLPIIHSKPIVHGVRIHLGTTEKLYAVLEYSKDSKFTASQTTTLYAYDWGRGNFDISDLDPEHTYNVRIATFIKERDQLPIDSVKQLESFQALYSKKPTRAAKPVDSTARSSARAADTILREMREKPNARFNSHADYLRYMAAKTRSEEH